MMADSEAMDKERRDAGEVGYEEPQGTGDKADVIYSRTSSHDSKQSLESIGGNENSGEPKVEIQVSKEKQERFFSKIEEQRDELEKAGVNVETDQRSIIITFNQEKGHVVTGKGIKDILLKLFDDIPQSSVLIQKQIDKLKEEIERLSQKTGSLTIECAGVTDGCVKDSTVVGLMIQLHVIPGSESQASVSTSASRETYELTKEQQAELYKQIKCTFVDAVNPDQLSMYLNLGPHDDERIFEKSKADGRHLTASHLLLVMFEKVPDWIDNICQGLRHPNIALGHVADDIEAKRDKIYCDGKKNSKQSDGSPTLETSVEPVGVQEGLVSAGSYIAASAARTLQDDGLVQILKAHTQEKLKSQTEGMIKMSAFDFVMKKLQDGQKWITITGNAGEGKTTLGYLVLQTLDSEEDVYIVDSPEELSQLYKSKQECTIILNDIFGQFNFDQSSVSKWSRHIAKILEDHEKSAKGEKQIRIIFISRWNVLQSAKDHLERYGTKILAPECVINLSASSVKTERIQLLDCYLKDLSIDSNVENRIADMDTPHGFPHCCKMYAELKSRGENIDITEFFKSPLKFLDQTTRVLMTRKEYKELFRDMIKSDGQVNPLKINDDKKRDRISKAASELNGSYIKKMSGHFMFTHPSIHESVVSVIGKIDSLFIVKYASMSVIMQMVNIKDNSGDEEKQENTDGTSDHVDIDPVPAILEVLCDRFRDQILKRDYSVFRHKFCDNQYFCERLVSTCVQEDPPPAKKREQGQQSCDEITSGETFGVNEVDNSSYTMLHRAAMGERLTAVGVLLEHGADVNRADGFERTALHLLCMSGKADTSTLQLPITHGADVNQADEDGMTALHHLCESGKADTSTLQLLITHGADVNAIDRDKMTPLHHLCESGKADTSALQLLITHGADVNATDRDRMTPLHHLCKSGKADTSTLQLLITHGADVNATDRDRMTPLHHLCKSGKADVSTIQVLINGGANASIVDKVWRTALDHLRGEVDADIVQLLTK